MHFVFVKNKLEWEGDGFVKKEGFLVSKLLLGVMSIYCTALCLSPVLSVFGYKILEKTCCLSNCFFGGVGWGMKLES